MTQYYTNKDDFDAGNLATWGSDFTSDHGATVTNMLSAIVTVTKVVNDNDCAGFYHQVGDAGLGKDMPGKTHMDAYNRVYKMMSAARVIHEEVVERIDRKVTKGLDNALRKADNVNGKDNSYKSRNLTYTKTHKGSTSNGGYTQEYSYTTQEHYTLGELLDDKNSPIQSTKNYYAKALSGLKTRIANMSEDQAAQVQNLRNMSDQELIDTYIKPRQMSYEGLKYTQFQEDNKELLGKVEQYLSIGLMVVTVVAGTALIIFSGGTTVPLVAGLALKTATVVGTTYTVAEGVSAATTGSSLISGTQMSESQRNFAVANAALSIATVGVSSKLSGAKGALSGIAETAEGFQAASSKVKTLETVSRGLDYANDALGVSEVGYSLVKGEDPTMAIAGLVSGKIASVGQSKLSTTNTDVDVTTKGKVTAGTTGAVSGVKVADVDVPKAKGPVETRTQADEIAVAQPKQTEKSYDREQILKNIEASRQAREASNFDNYLRKEYAAQGKYFAERIAMPNGKSAYLSVDTTYEGEQIPVRSRGYLDDKGHIKWPDEDGFVLDSAGKPITEPANLKAGQVIDRYGNFYGAFTSPVENGRILQYNTRGLPYAEGFQAYHQYEVVVDLTEENIINSFENAPKEVKDGLLDAMDKRGFTLSDLFNIRKGGVDKVFGQGGGAQIKLGQPLKYYEDLGLLREVMK